MYLDYPVDLHEACRGLSPIHPDHTTLPIQEGFNWSSCLAEVPFSRLYLVVFRSVRRATADLELLKEHDDLVKEEAGDLAFRRLGGELPGQDPPGVAALGTQ